jgi:hypothetical protein
VGRVFANADWERKDRALEAPDTIAFDRRSRPEFGPIGDLFRRQDEAIGDDVIDFR